MKATITIDPSKKIGKASRLLFGHNLEHTRNAIYKGLSAQLIRNRKFAGNPNMTGQAMEWYIFGPKQAYFELRSVDTYTEFGSTHVYGPKPQALLTQSIQCSISGKQYGIGQDRVPLQKGTEYEFRIATKSTDRVPLTVTIKDEHRRRTIYSQTLQVGFRKWKKEIFTFTSNITDENARVEISANQSALIQIGSVSLLPSDNFLGMRRDVIQNLKDIGTTMLRWPGGNFAGDYRWQDGLLEVDKRAPVGAFSSSGLQAFDSLPYTHGFDMHEIGTDDFLALCKEIGCEPSITLNVGWESIEISVAWLEYCNGDTETTWGKIRAERGHPEPYNVKFWSLGNEFGFGHMDGPNDPKEYTKRMAPLVKALKKTAPSIRLIISGNWTWIKDKDKWYTQVLNKLYNKVEYLSHHCYAPSVKPSTKPYGKEGIKRYEAVIDGVRIVEEALAMIGKKIAQLSPKAKDIQIAYDEWNIWGAWWRKPTVADGMHVALVLNKFCSDFIKYSIGIGNFFEPINEGAILVEPFKSELSTIGKVMEFYKDHHDNTALLAKSSCSKLHVAATINHITNRLVITLVNTSGKDNIQADMKIDGGELHDVCCEILYAPDIDIGTTFSTKKCGFRKNQQRISVAVPRYSVVKITVEN